jgi:hypothetical protein
MQYIADCFGPKLLDHNLAHGTMILVSLDRGRPSAPGLGSTNTASAAPIPENRGSHSNWAEGGYKIDDTSVGDARYLGMLGMSSWQSAWTPPI